ncbi:MAG: hypothetical protein H7831_08780 [Magnetococcus sp. WYHC-3]
MVRSSAKQRRPLRGPLWRNILAPVIVDTILRGDYPVSISLEKLRAGIPLDWEEQQELFGVRAA